MINKNFSDKKFVLVCVVRGKILLSFPLRLRVKFFSIFQFVWFVEKILLTPGLGEK